MTDVRILMGPTGSGKSSRIVQEMSAKTAAEPIGSPLFWVVPDDVAFAAEQMLMGQLSSVLRSEVITFARLADRMRETAAGSRLTTINGTGKRLLFASVYRELQDELGPLKRVQTSSGFYQMVLDAFDEMSRHQVNLSALQGALEAAAASLAEQGPGTQMTTGRSLLGKLRDLCVLYVRYRELLAERAFFDAALNLTEAARTADAVSWLGEAEFYIDGFASLDPQQLAFCLALAQHAKRCTFVFPLPEALPEQTQQMPFDHAGQWVEAAPLSAWLPQIEETNAAHVPGAAHTLIRLIQALRKQDIQFHVEEMTDTRRFQDDALALVEQQLRNLNKLPESVPATDGIEFWQAQDDEAEAALVAATIVGRVAQGNLAYRDIAILVPSLQEDGPRIAQTLQRFDVPHVMDVYPPLAAHPLGRFCLAALRVVTEHLSVDAMARFLRTDDCGLPQWDADWLDIYVRTYDIAGDAWLADKPWSFAADRVDAQRKEGKAQEDERAEALRQTLRKHLQPFVTALTPTVLTPMQLASALWDLLTSVGAKRRISALVVGEGAGSNPLQASQHEQAWQQVVALFNDLARVHKDAPFLREELFELVTQAFLSEHQTSIPSGIDRVFITAYAHAHMWTKTQVFVLGLDDRTLPAKVSPRGLLQDEEREMFARLFGMPLGYTAVEQMAVDRQLPYMLFTRARSRLMLSYAAHRAGSEQQPSTYFQRLRSACSAPLQSAPAAFSPAGDEDARDVPVLTSAVALDWLVRLLANAVSDGTVAEVLARPEVQDIAHWFTQTEARVASLQQALGGLSHRLPKGKLKPALVAKLYGNPIAASVHRLETYAACPYQYFVRYGLGVEPARFDAVQGTDVGNLLHDIVFALVDVQRQDTDAFAARSYDEVIQLADELFAEQLARPQYAVFRERAARRARAFDMQTQVHAIAEMLWLHAKQSDYRPYALEWSFGMDGDTAAPYVIELNSGVQVLLRGRVDRLDIHQADDTTWYRIMDYKSGANHRIDTTKLYYGLQLQLMVYMAVVEAHLGTEGKARAAGAFYLPLLTQPKIAEVPAEEQAARTLLHKTFQAQGYMRADEDVITAMDNLLKDGTSDLFPSIYTKSGTLRKGAKVWTGEAWDSVLQLTMHRVREIAERMASGRIPVRPYLHAHNDRGCTHCPYAGVCHFEPASHARSYRVLTPRKLADIIVATEADGLASQGGEHA